MRAEWYGDKRDLVKWAALLHLAKEHEAGLILQIALLQDSAAHFIEVDGRSVEVPPAVLSHFRDIKSVTQIESACQVEVFDPLFDDRKKYFEALDTYLRLKQTARKIVFLDPDTGLAPKKADFKHVKADELKGVFNALNKGDLLVFYQHKRRLKNWVEALRREFAAALKVKPKAVTTVTGMKIANDVAFFAAESLGTPC